MCLMQANDFGNVHLYLDLGASLEICKGPVDILAADAVRELLAFETEKPILLAESGAVEPGHSGPFKLYKKDKAGIILHDVTFAPFFAGAAGTGQIWHWDQYVAANNLWFQFGRFAEATKEINPLPEAFEPIELKHPRLRVYALQGKHMFLAWCRDKQNTWQSELAEGKQPTVIRDASIQMPYHDRESIGASVHFYDPWANSWTRGDVKDNQVHLPEFVRSLVVKIEY